jgi:hypothetical protein
VVFGYSRISLIRHSFDMFPAWRTRQASTITAFTSTITAFRWLQGLGHRPAKAEIPPSMLPGFRFLFAAILLSTSILVFGLGAAALLRATHEQFVSNPAWRNGPQEQVFAQASEPAQPELAVFRAEPLPSANSLPDEVPNLGLPASEPERVAALTSEASGQPDTPATDAPAGEPAKAEAPSPPTDTPAAPVTKSASAETAPPVSGAAPGTSEASPTPAAAPEPQPAEAASAAAPSDTPTQVAALADPATAAPQDPPATAKAASDTPENKAAKPRAHRARKRQRIVRPPPPAPVPLQQVFNPFAAQPLQQQPAYAATTRTR